MKPETLQHANGLSRTLNSLRAVLAAIVNLIGLTEEAKESLKAEVQKHHDDVQAQLDKL